MKNRVGKEHIDSYLICATPRTGSTLLCGLLASTKVAGRPESYFRELDEQLWAHRWNLVRSSVGVVLHSEFVQAALAAGRTDNGVFAARIMWGTLDHLFDVLGSVHPAPAGGDFDLLNRAFGHTRFVHLYRDDVLAQAVSWHRAEQTNVWHRTDQAESKQPEQEPRFDFDEIRKLVRTIEEHNSAWRAWFASVGTQPHTVRYEDLGADPVGVTGEILDFLGLKLPPGHRIKARHRRLADELNAQWIDRYRAELP
ncbi:MAG: Stf0 family sulfotransferase [Gammaproteobacteria bacterium]|nr:Stf0 family sulfotransferase [Gammaproteobacteria bacterium]